MPMLKLSDAAKSALLFILICLAVEACSERARNSGGGRTRGGMKSSSMRLMCRSKSYVATPEYLGGF